MSVKISKRLSLRHNMLIFTKNYDPFRYFFKLGEPVLYLFNSAYRPLLTTNVFNTLFIPMGGTNEYRYRFRPAQDRDYCNINPEEIYNLECYQREGPVLISFIDRYAIDGYVYHPLRFGKYVLSYKTNDYLFFRVQLDAFVYPIDIKDFNHKMRHALSDKGIPSLTNNDPQNTNDGNYAIIGDSLFSYRKEFYSGDEAWIQAVDEIQKCRVFSGEMPENDDESKRIKNVEAIFIRGEIKKTSNNSVRTKLINDNAYFSIATGENYELVLTYRYPCQLTDTSRTAKLNCHFGENLRPLGNKEIRIDSCTNSISVPFTTKRYLEEFRDGISFSYCSDSTESKVFATNFPIHFSIHESSQHNAKIICLLFVYALLNVIIGTDFSQISPLTIKDVISALSWVKLGSGFFQAFTLYWILKLIGKRIF